MPPRHLSKNHSPGAPGKKTPRPKRTAVSPEVERRIAEAVAELPHLVRHDSEEMTGGTAQRAALPPMNAAEDKKRRRLLWAGVASCTAVIFGLWIVSMQNVFATVRESGGEEIAILERARRDSREMVASIEAAIPESRQLPLAPAQPESTFEATFGAIISALSETLAATATATPNLPTAAATTTDGTPTTTETNL